ncbi:hypothetical protein D3C75_1132130 [compost metagenome]
MVEALRVTDSDNFGADLDAVGITKCYGREVCTFNFQYCKVQIFAGAEQFRFIWLGSTVYCNLDNIGTFDYVLVSQNVSVGIIDKACSNSVWCEL